MTSFSTQSHCPDTEQTSPCPIRIVKTERQAAFATSINLVSRWFDLAGIQTPDVLHGKLAFLSIRLPHPVAVFLGPEWGD